MSDLTYKQLLKSTSDLAQEVMANAQAVQADGQYVDNEARDTGRVADMIGSMGVDPETLGETRQLAGIVSGVSQGAIAYVAAADTTARTARAAHDQTRSSHGGIHQAYQRAPVDISNMKPDWLRQD